MKFKHSFLIACLCPVLLAGCSMHSKAEDDILDVELPLKTTNIAPYETDDTVKMGATETLFKVSNDGKVTPHLVKDYQQVTPQTLKLTLKSNIHFQNGKLLTGEKVKQSLEYALSHGDLLKSTLPIQHIEAHGQSVTLTTKEPYPELTSELASPFAAIFDTKAKEKVTDHPIGTGPYEVKKYQPSQGITLQPYSDYWHGHPRLKGIRVTYQEDGLTRVNHLEAGAADVITDVPVTHVERLEANAETHVQHVNGYRTQMLLYNHDSVKMTPSVRAALDNVINREGIVDAISKGYATPASGPFNTELKFLKETPVHKQNLAKARHLMEKAGYNADHPLKLTVASYDGRPELPKIAQVIQSDAEKAHIDIDIRNVEDIEGFLANRKQWDASLYSIGTFPRGDSGYFFNQAYLKQGGINKGDYDNPKIKALIEKLNHTVGEKARHELTNDIIQQSQPTLPNSYISYNETIHATQSRVKHLETTPSDIYLIDEKVAITDGH
ncbi:ABC transporter substrate-binding protein [Staphylococcus chromogenes]|uniref:ABC transporter substrate-binding protein n=1 Tax=Staphylococcus chromogenes TaxID=46126 RepID=UPI00118B52C2|nr:ABC transporter substrate-binding protein [Staphylococcus chromogenes]